MLRNNNGEAIIESVRVADSPLKRLTGLMFERKEKFNYGLVFDLGIEKRIGASVHMAFVFFPIFIVFLNNDKKVVDKAVLNPWVLNYTPKEKCRYFIELPVVKEKEVKIGDYLEW